MKDFLNNELAIGDGVLFRTPSYSSLAVGVVTAFTAQKVRLSYINTWNYGPQGYLMSILLDPSVVAWSVADKITEEMDRIANWSGRSM